MIRRIGIIRRRPSEFDALGVRVDRKYEEEGWQYAELAHE
jgi:hypothetical protein